MAKQTQILIRGTLILSLAGLIAKIVSVFYKVPLEYLTGTVGLGYYQETYPLYSLLTAAGLIGIPNSISKLVAEEIARKEFKEAHQTFRHAFILSGALGLVVSLLLLVFGKYTIHAVNIKESGYYALMGLSIAPVFISTAGAIRGYLQGMQIMHPTAISQIIENMFKVILGIGFVVLLLNQQKSIAVAIGGAAVGVSLGFVLSTLYLSTVYLSHRKTIYQRISTQKHVQNFTFSQIAKKIALMAIPVTIASAAFSIMGLIDNNTLPRILGDLMIAEGLQMKEGNFLIGVLGKVQTIISVPMVLSVSLIISVVPSISAASVLSNKEELRHKIKESIEIALKVGLPAATGIFVLAGPILTFIYGEPEGSDFLMFYAASLVFIIVSQSLIGILQGMTRHYVPVFIVLGSALIKIIVNVLLISSPLKGYGALIGTLVFYSGICFSCYYVIKKEVQLKLDLYHTFGKPMISSAVMGVATYGAYTGIHRIVSSNAAVTLLSVVIGVLIYGVLMVFLKAFTRDEIMIMPQHQKILSWLEKRQLIRD